MNRQFKGTPGDWRQLPSAFSGQDRKEINVVGYGRTVCVVYYDNTALLGDVDESKANARAIAAVPDMIEALSVMVDIFNTRGIDPLKAFVAVERGRAALNKALGEEESDA